MSIQEPAYIQTLKGVKRLRKVSLGKRTDLSVLLNEVFRLMTENVERDMSFSQLYDTSELFKAVCNDAVGVCGLNPDDLDIDTLFCLLLPHTAEGGNVVRENGILALLNFPETIVGKLPEKNPTHMGMEQTIAMLWSISNDLQGTLDSIYDDRLDAEALLRTLDELSKLKNPEEYFKRKMKRKAQDSLLRNQKVMDKGQWEEVEL